MADWHRVNVYSYNMNTVAVFACRAAIFEQRKFLAIKPKQIFKCRQCVAAPTHYWRLLPLLPHCIVFSSLVYLVLWKKLVYNNGIQRWTQRHDERVTVPIVSTSLRVSHLCSAFEDCEWRVAKLRQQRTSCTILFNESASPVRI